MAYHVSHGMLTPYGGSSNRLPVNYWTKASDMQGGRKKSEWGPRPTIEGSDINQFIGMVLFLLIYASAFEMLSL